MIRESNAELFSTRTSLSTTRLEVQSASEMLGATENGSLSRKGHEPIDIFSLGIEMLQTIRSREKNRGADVELENQDCIENRSISNTISLVQKQQKKSLPRQGELLTKYTSAEVLEKEG
ncbi:hypothetical protein OIU74_015965 [Salix koriyanagi]|uniref:Uncharacterized protein n=1 Tax=Salix koriyanagi TaxID=2511006 RepID=A0A9Q0SVU9_9ROSI|nr:hypothetical protein OIU74_015965 [Salix koriyanagi]